MGEYFLVTPQLLQSSRWGTMVYIIAKVPVRPILDINKLWVNFKLVDKADSHKKIKKRNLLKKLIAPYWGVS